MQCASPHQLTLFDLVNVFLLNIWLLSFNTVLPRVRILIWLIHFHLIWRSESMKRSSRARYLHCRSLVSMSSSSDRKSTTRMTQATRTQLKPALSRQTCHRATRRPQQGFSHFDLWKGHVHTFSRADARSRSPASLHLTLWRMANRGKQSSLMKRDFCSKPQAVLRGQQGPVKRPLDRLLWLE